MKRSCCTQTDLTNELEEMELNKSNAEGRPSSALSKGALSHVSHGSMTESEDDDDDDFEDRPASLKNFVARDDFDMYVIMQGCHLFARINLLMTQHLLDCHVVLTAWNTASVRL